MRAQAGSGDEAVRDFRAAFLGHIPRVAPPKPASEAELSLCIAPEPAIHAASHGSYAGPVPQVSLFATTSAVHRNPCSICESREEGAAAAFCTQEFTRKFTDPLGISARRS
jgi:hypothetical protein